MLNGGSAVISGGSAVISGGSELITNPAHHGKASRLGGGG